MDTHLKRIEGVTYTPKSGSKQFYIEGYGYRPWGDAVLWLYPDAPYPRNVSWSGNYSDFSLACLLQYMRTGDLDFLDQFELHTMHEADVFTVNHHPNKTLIGACRYCPPRNHVGIEDAGKTQQPYVSLEFNHHKAQSTFALWYLLGDERMRDVAMLKLNNAFSNHEADNGWRQIRGPGAQLATLYMGYELTGEAKYLERIREIVKRAQDHLKKNGPDAFAHASGKFMYGIGMEGILYEYELTGDPSSLALVRALADHLIDWMSKRNQTRLHPNTTFALAVLYHKTGDPKYKQICLSTLEGVEAHDGGEVKAVGQSFRNAPRAFHYLTVPPE